MSNLSSIELLLSFVITWTIVLVPPAIIRYIYQKPLSKGVAITLAIVLYFANKILFTAMGSQSKSHAALLIGSIFCFYVLRWQTSASAARTVAEQRKAHGDDEWSWPAHLIQHTLTGYHETNPSRIFLHILLRKSICTNNQSRRFRETLHSQRRIRACIVFANCEGLYGWFHRRCREGGNRYI